MGAGREEAPVGVHSLDHFALAVPDPGEARRFYSAFGLDVRDEGDGLALRAHGSAHCWGVIRPGSRKQLAWLSFGAFAEDMPRLEERLRRKGVERARSPQGAPRDGLWFFDVDGVPVHVGVAEKCSANGKASAPIPCCGEGVRGARKRSEIDEVRPRRLSHVLRFTPDVPRAIAFYEDALGLRLSDTSGDGIGFMHGIHGSDHHILAFAKSSAPGYHHSSWDLRSLEDVGLGGMQMAALGHTRGWGPGRHVLGSNYFWYVQDPWGSFAEYSSDIDYVPKGTRWEAGDHAAQDAFYLWGPAPPADFVTNYEAQG